MKKIVILMAVLTLLLGLFTFNALAQENVSVYIDGEITEDYVKAYTSDFKLSDIGYQKIPEDHYFVLGDNRTNSMDSRDYRVGLIHKKDIIGKRLLTIFR